MKFLRCIVAAVAVLSAPAVAQNAAFKPVGPWAADYGTDYCLLGRVFSDGKNQLTFMMERTQPGPFLRLSLTGEGVKPFKRAPSWGAKFGPAGQGWKAAVLQAKTADGTQYYDLGPTTLVAVPTPTPGSAPAFKPYDKTEERAAAKALNSFEVAEGLSQPLRIETGGLEAPVGALQACVSDLIASWGLDAKRHETISSPAKPQAAPATWVPNGTYPFSEFPKLRAGKNTIRVLIDAAGKPTSCVVQRPTAGEAYNKTACDNLMKNAQFTPALDSAGQPMASFWITEVYGLMPPPPGGAPRR